MDLSFRHDLWFKLVARSPVDLGWVDRIVIRPGGGESGAREVLSEVEVTHDGLRGDRWPSDPGSQDGGQVSLVNARVIDACAGHVGRRAILSGDNLHVDLDLSEQNLPVGSLLRIGTVTLIVSELPHRPCAKFHERFGRVAAQRVARANRVGRRGRGVLCRVLEPGKLRVGDTIHVERGLGSPGDRREDLEPIEAEGDRD